MTTKSKTYYAVSYPYGVSDVAEVHKFKTKKDRDEWVDRGSPYRTNPGYRLPVSAAEARRLSK